MLKKLLKQKKFSEEDLIFLLSLTHPEDLKLLFARSAQVKKETVKNIVYLRGLLEYSNICYKNCFYCGIRKDNTAVNKYEVSLLEAMQSVAKIYDLGYGSLVIQSGERTDSYFLDNIYYLLKNIYKSKYRDLGITLSLGEHSPSVYEKFRELNVERYLLRIESSSERLYQKIHPPSHSFQKRIKCLRNLQELGFQTGTGVMIGFPGQSTRDLAKDLLFFQEFDIDMVGMGPYIEADNTPMLTINNEKCLEERFSLSLKMIAILRIMMPDINIAASTAMQTVKNDGREKAILVGANIVMPNITPQKYHGGYHLYDHKPIISEDSFLQNKLLEESLLRIGHSIGYHQKGNSPHYYRRRFPKCSN